MSMFRPVTNDAAHLKLGLFGFQGAGKTTTAALIAIGMKKLMTEKRIPGWDLPIGMIDSEGGRSWIKPLIEKEFGLGSFVGVASGAFADLVAAIPDAERNCSVLIQDSATTHWVEFVESYKEKKGRTRGLVIDDWAWLKQEWRRKFVNPYLNSNLHFIMCGRAGFEYSHFEDAAGMKQFEKSGIRMKSEAETGYEPSLVIMMEREIDLSTNKMTHIGHILKDRRCDEHSLDGKAFRNITFADILPHVEYLNLGGRNMAHDDTRSSVGLIDEDVRKDQTSLRRRIVVQEIDALLDAHGAGGTSGDARAKRSKLLAGFFGTTAKAEIEELMPLDDLRLGFNRLSLELEGKPCRYFPAEPAPVLDDAIPDFSAEAAPLAAEPAKPVPEPVGKGKPKMAPAKPEKPARAKKPSKTSVAITSNIMDAAKAGGDKADIIAAVTRAAAPAGELPDAGEKAAINVLKTQLIQSLLAPEAVAS
jgi:hypothetical protein